MHYTYISTTSHQINLKTLQIGEIIFNVKLSSLNRNYYYLQIVSDTS